MSFLIFVQPSFFSRDLNANYMRSNFLMIVIVFRYVAPEILKSHPLDETSDLWSVGGILHVLRVGYRPFMEDNLKLYFAK